ncbi:MAG TPA: 4Fe-4S dicluster domain-containing protein [Paracoccaceae bacterium]|nr:4Fe-4S dicluster domain-containing protein [Paracoccaceae bacterium]
MSVTGKGKPPLWRSREERDVPDPGRSDEFPGLDRALAAGVDRRTALKLGAAAFGMAGLTACDAPEEEILPYVDQPEGLIPGSPQHYATTLLAEGFGIGAVIESHEGRPTKVEGNPDHPASLGATDAVMQVACLGLFDPHRSRLPLRGGEGAGWAEIDLMLAALGQQMRSNGGADLAILTGPTTSPSLGALLDGLRREYSGLRIYRHAPLGTPAIEICGQRVMLRPRLEKASVIFSLDADFLGEGPGKLAHARGFAARRSVTNDPSVPPAMNRLYAVETTATITGAMADHRWGIRPSALGAVAAALAARLTGAQASNAMLPEGETPIPPPALDAIAEDLHRAGDQALVLAGPHLDPALQNLAAAMNSALGSMGQSIEAFEADGFSPEVDGGLTEFLDDIATRRGAALLLETNPVYTAPGDLDVEEALAEVPLSIHLGLYRDETGMLCNWHLPAAHVLESWGDARAFDGTASPIQPLIRPLYNGRTPAELLAALLGQPATSAHEITAAHWAGRGVSPIGWNLALKKGLFEGAGIAPVTLDCGPIEEALAALPPAKPPAALELRILPDPYLRDGVHASNAVLQELPRPLTKTVWGNAASIAPATAREMGIESEDLVELVINERSAQIPAWIQPGHPEGVVSITLGFGRRRAGEDAYQRGTDAYPLRASDALWTRQGVELRKLGIRGQIITLQHHHRMEGREPVRRATLADYVDNPDIIHEGHDPPPDRSLYSEWGYPGHAWGMVIDQSVCIGCNACVQACQAENNSPVVGPEQCDLGREMHWLRIDRYYAGPEETPETLFQPVPCMHCEKAPCEIVCPVNATVHTHEGLNAQVYNRCIGTRYCSQNCPYKVRRFNFFGYNPFDEGNSAATAPAMNPNVSVRSRGVMEKCTYCVQRIQAASIRADIERRPIAEGEVMTACQQACPTRAISFGDLNRAGSETGRLRAHNLDYELLGHLNTRPRTTYLGRLSNPNPALQSQEQGDG